MKKRICSVILCAVMLLVLLPMLPITAEAADKVVEVSTVEQLRAALENDAGAHVRLTKDISFTRANAADSDVGVYLGDGIYTIDLNGHTIKYHYMTGGEFSDQGEPICIGGEGNETKMLVINGPGSIIGGITGIKGGSNKSTLIVNGGTIKGIMGNGIRGGGLIYINGGSVIGNFGSIEYEQGVVVLNGGDVKKVNYKPFNKKMEQENGYGVIRNGVLTGHAVLWSTILDVTDLTVSEGSSITVRENGGLVVRNSFVNKGTLTHESGLKSIGGEAVIKPSANGNYAPPEIMYDMSFKSLDIQGKAHLKIKNGAVVTVTDAFSSGTDSSVVAENGTLRLLGSIDHKGRSEGLPELAALENHGGGPGGGPGGGAPVRDFIHETITARRLKGLGLFQGVGTNPDGSTNFDLTRRPSRVEALVMLIRLLGKDNEAKNGDWKHTFTDVPGWADKYVGYAYEKGLTNGISATEFGTGEATGQMYLTFALRALGYSDAAGGDFSWKEPEKLAMDIELLPHRVNMSDFLRGDVALVSDSALSTRLKNSEKTLLDRLITDGAVMKPDNSGLINALTTPGNASVTLTGDVIIDMTGLEIDGGKEIILNGFTLALTGSYRITDKAYLDINPGKGPDTGAFDISTLRYDHRELTVDFSGELPIMEIQPGTIAGLPPEGYDVFVHRNPDGRIVITSMPMQ